MIYTFNVTNTAHVSSYAIKLYYCNSITKIMRAPSRCDLRYIYINILSGQ